MRKRLLGRTGLEVSQIGFGGIKLPEVSMDDSAELLNAALDMGIKFIDTARNYKDSEEKIGRALENRRDEYIIATKSSARDRAGLRKDLETSLANLRTDRIDLYQLHTVSSQDTWRQVMGNNGAYAEARKARREGLIDHIGITIHRDLDVMRQAISCQEFETIMVCYSPIDTEHVGPEIIPMAAQKGLGVIIMKALSGGMLVSEGFEQGNRAGDEDPLVGKCLKFVLSNSAVSCVIPGMRNLGELRQNVRVGQEFQPMDEKEQAELISMIGRTKKSFRYGQVCLQCGYCQPCPQGINIPETMRALMIVESYPDDLKEQGYQAYSSLEVKADACVECRACVGKCPAGIDIPKRLETAHELMRSS